MSSKLMKKKLYVKPAPHLVRITRETTNAKCGPVSLVFRGFAIVPEECSRSKCGTVYDK